MNQPNPLPINQAASAPIGATQGSELSVIAELLIGIVLPLVVPALLLAMARAIAVEASPALRLDELSFGIAGVAIASLVRAASRRDWSWPGFIIFLILALIWFAGLGLALNRESGVDEVVAAVRIGMGTYSPPLTAEQRLSGGEAADQFLSDLARVDSQRSRAEPRPWIWMAVILPGLLLIALAGAYIVRVRR
jgi:hypothetical protein